MLVLVLVKEYAMDCIMNTWWIQCKF